MKELKKEILNIIVANQHTYPGGEKNLTEDMVVSDFEKLANDIALFIQAITDPENQPNQYGIKL